MAKFGIALGSGPRGLGFESRHSDHNWTPILIRRVSKRVSSFFCVKSLICKVFSILFNDNRLYSDSETVAAEPVCFSLYILYNERSVGCASFNDYHFLFTQTALSSWTPAQKKFVHQSIGGCVNRVEEPFKQFFRGAVAQLPARASVPLASGKADGVCGNAPGWPCRRPRRALPGSRVSCPDCSYGGGVPRRSSFATVDGEQPLYLAMALFA